MWKLPRNASLVICLSTQLIPRDFSCISAGKLRLRVIILSIARCCLRFRHASTRGTSAVKPELLVDEPPFFSSNSDGYILFNAFGRNDIACGRFANVLPWRWWLLSDKIILVDSRICLSGCCSEGWTIVHYVEQGRPSLRSSPAVRRPLNLLGLPIISWEFVF